MADQQYQSLYRQFRPQRFAQVRGQDHVTRALQNAVRGQRVAHAYLFSGPRGTGKTSTARILAKALNCTNLQDGEPCGTCPSCVAVQSGSSLDVLELDAASNNGVDAMRDLVARAALTSPGQWKVYIVDEVHMLSTAASNALLKTLEEPPSHVVFVLATTDPQKVLPTIRSRTQHFDFRLLGTETLTALVRDVNAAAGLGLDGPTLDRVVQRGNGSARDMLSVLDQVAAAGEAEDDLDTAAAVVDALGEHDVARLLAAVATACSAGRDPRRIAVDVIERLRACFLAIMAPSLVDVSDEQRAALAESAGRVGTPALVRGMEVLGEALVTMRDAVDTRVTLEVALVRLGAAEADTSVAALLERIDRLERRLAQGGAPAAIPSPVASSPAPATPGIGDPGRASLGAFRRKSEPPVPALSAEPAVEVTDDRPSAKAGLMPDRDEITKAWGDTLLARLDPGVRSVYRSGRWLAVDDQTAVFAVPNALYLDRAEAKRRNVEEALSAFFGVRAKIRLVEDDGTVSSDQARVAPEEEVDLTASDVAEMAVAKPVPIDASAEDRVRLAFPGAEEVPT